MLIRQETEKDYGEIYNVVKTAFQTAKVSDGKEQDFVNKLRSSKNYIPELALVAEEDKKLIGHIMLTKTYIITNMAQHETLLLAPISVLPEHRGKGIGAKLISTSFRIAKNMDYRSVFLVGDIDYYNRFGFQPSVYWNIKNRENIPDKFVLACELTTNSLEGIEGTIVW